MAIRDTVCIRDAQYLADSGCSQNSDEMAGTHQHAGDQACFDDHGDHRCEARGLVSRCQLSLLQSRAGFLLARPCLSDVAAAAACNHVARGLATPSLGVGKPPEGTRVAASTTAITPCISFPCL